MRSLSTPICAAQDLLRALMEREDGVGEPGVDNRTRHTPHHAGLAVLSDDRSALGFEGLSAAQAVLTHAGQNSCDGGAAIDVGRGTEERIDGGAAEILRGGLVEVNPNLAVTARYGHVEVTGSDQNVAPNDSVSFRCLAGGQLAMGVEALGEKPGKKRRHVLHNENGKRKIRGYLRQEIDEGRRSTGRASDDDDSWREPKSWRSAGQ
jgi:hypothetical protein